MRKNRWKEPSQFDTLNRRAPYIDSLELGETVGPAYITFRNLLPSAPEGLQPRPPVCIATAAKISSFLGVSITMNLRFSSAALIALTVLAGCGQSAQSMNDLSLGMTRQNVVSILGTPQSVQAAGNQEVLTYTLSNSWNSQFWNSEYRVVLQNGRVVAYG